MRNPEEPAGRIARRNRYADCFARVRGKKRYCAALEIMNCEHCPFYKSKEQMAEEVQTCSQRLRNLGATQAANQEYELYLTNMRQV